MPLTTQEVEALKKITSPSVANAIETFKVRPREQGNLSSDIRALFPEMGPMVGYAVPCVIRAEQGPIEGHRASTYGWWDFVLTIPAPRGDRGARSRRPAGPGRPVGRGAGQHPPRARLRRRGHRRLGARPRRGARARLPVLRGPRVGLARQRAHGGLRHPGQGGRRAGSSRAIWSTATSTASCTIPHEIAAKIPEAIAKVEADEREIISVCQSPGLHRRQAQGALQADPSRHVLRAPAARRSGPCARTPHDRDPTAPGGR